MKERKRNRHQKVDKRKMMNKHHLTNKCRGGGNEKENIAILHIERHEHWHKVFGNKSLREVIELLERFERLKNYQRTCPP